MRTSTRQKLMEIQKLLSEQLAGADGAKESKALMSEVQAFWTERKKLDAIISQTRDVAFDLRKKASGIVSKAEDMIEAYREWDSHPEGSPESNLGEAVEGFAGEVHRVIGEYYGRSGDPYSLPAIMKLADGWEEQTKFVERTVEKAYVAISR